MPQTSGATLLSMRRLRREEHSCVPSCWLMEQILPSRTRKAKHLWICPLQMTSSVCCRTRCPALQCCPPPPSWCCRPPLSLITLLLDFLQISKEQQLLWEQLQLCPQLLCPAEQLWLPQLLLSQL